MSQPPAPRVPMRGAVDLAAVAAQHERRRQAEAAAANGAAAPTSPYVVEASEAQFQQVVEQSMQVPVVVDLFVHGADACAQLNATLEALATDYAGRFLLVEVDVDANPRIAQVFQAQSVPAVVAVVKGQPVPLFQGALPEPQVRQYLDELLRIAEANGVTGTVPGAPADAPDDDGAGAGLDDEPELPPLHQAAYEAIEADDLDAAATAYQQALAQDPADELAKAGLAQVHLLQRTRGADLQTARAAAAAAPTDVEAQLLAADLDLLGGHVEDALQRLVDTVRVTAGEDRDAVRVHLLELFEVVGPADERVARARRALSAALF